MMKVERIRKIVSGWREVVNHRFEEIKEDPELINVPLSFDLEVGTLTKDQIQSVVDEITCGYVCSMEVGSKVIKVSPIEDSLKYDEGYLSFDAIFYYD